jgi:CRP-like cAMP-binding protein
MVPFMVLGPGDFFGEFCFLDEFQNSYHFVCYKDAKCFFLKQEIFQNISREFDWEIIKLKLFAKRRMDYYSEVHSRLCIYFLEKNNL